MVGPCRHRRPVAYSLVGLSYHIAHGGSRKKNHFVTQLRVRGRWHKYDCLAGGRRTFFRHIRRRLEQLVAVLTGVPQNFFVRRPPTALRATRATTPSQPFWEATKPPSSCRRQQRVGPESSTPIATFVTKPFKTKYIALCGPFSQRSQLNECRGCPLRFLWRHVYQAVRPNF
ncbi:unnamed protein product, partial [Ectocarpus fasciculatus]